MRFREESWRGSAQRGIRQVVGLRGCSEFRPPATYTRRETPSALRGIGNTEPRCSLGSGHAQRFSFITSCAAGHPRTPRSRLFIRCRAAHPAGDLLQEVVAPDPATPRRTRSAYFAAGVLLLEGGRDA